MIARGNATNSEKRSGYKVGESSAVKLETLLLPINNKPRDKYEPLDND